MARLWSMLLLFTLAGCVKIVTIVPLDDQRRVVSDAQVTADGRDVGVGVTDVEVLHGSLRVSVAAGPQWLPGTAVLDDASPSRLEVMLRPNDLYLTTTEDRNQVVNQWINITIAGARRTTWWSTVVAAMSGADFELEIMDAASGFVRTAWRQRSYGPFVARRRFTGNIVTQDPLTWRIRYEVQYRQQGEEDWRDYDRGFADDLRVLQEIRARTEQ